MDLWTDGSQKRADIVLDYAGWMRTTIMDACVVSPVAASYVDASQTLLGAARKRVAQKISKYAHLCPDADFLPLCVESYGAWCEEMQEFVGRVALEWARQAADDQTERAIARAIAQFTADWQVRISVALQRGNAYALIHRGRRDRQRAGRQCRARGHMHTSNPTPPNWDT